MALNKIVIFLMYKKNYTSTILSRIIIYFIIMFEKAIVEQASIRDGGVGGFVGWGATGRYRLRPMDEE
jgi:hypothetical protein